MPFKVFCATDEAYLEMTHVMVHSLVKTNRAAVSRIDVFGWRLGERGARALESIAPDLVRVHRVDDLPAALEPIRARVVGMVPTWLRFVGPDLVPADAEHLVYIDSDCVVVGDIGDLANLDLGTRLLAAVADFAVDKHPAWLRRLGMPAGTPYFNSGVMVIDHRRYRAEGWCRRAVEVTRADPDRLMLNDQDALNILMDGDWLPLPATFNAHAMSPRTRQGDRPEPFVGARVVHFIGRVKPTDADCLHAEREVYRRLRAETLYAGRPLRAPWRRAMAERLRKGIGAIERFAAGHGLRAG